MASIRVEKPRPRPAIPMPFRASSTTPSLARSSSSSPVETLSSASPPLEILVAAMGLRSPWPLLERMAIPEDVAVLVVNQCPERAEDDLPADVDDGRVRMRSFAERGISRSRNRALDLARGRRLLLADEDCTIVPEIASIVERAFTLDPAAGGITFQHRIEQGEVPSRRYRRRSFRHGRFSIVRVASVEIVLDREAVGDLRFDERFGLGTPRPIGEENLLLASLLRRGVRLRYVPEVVCVHRGATRSDRIDGRLEHADEVAALLVELYPTIWPAAAVASALGQGGRGTGRLRRSRWFARLLAAGRAHALRRRD